MRTYFIEGLQGAGKSFLLNILKKNFPDNKVYEENDVSPIDFSYCAYTNEEEYQYLTGRFPEASVYIRMVEYQYHDKKVFPFYRIWSEEEGLYEVLEKYDVFNRDMPKDEFIELILNLFSEWDGAGAIYECALFQNIVGRLMLHYLLDDEEIVDLYKKIRDYIQDKDFLILYLDVNDIKGTVEKIKVERVDKTGRMLWYPMMESFVCDSAYGRKYNLTGIDGIVKYMEHRKMLEKRLMNELFTDRFIILKSKEFTEEELIKQIS